MNIANSKVKINKENIAKNIDKDEIVIPETNTSRERVEMYFKIFKFEDGKND